jgi:hypothetical protein
VTDVAVALNPAQDEAGREVVLVKLSTPTWEFNFWATQEDLTGLSSIRDANWLARSCLHIGQSAGAPVHWAAEGETGDIALTVPIATVDTIVADAGDGSWRLS